MKSEKTNVMRLLDKAKIKYEPHEYPHGSEAVDGLTVAKLCGFDPECVFKTLVARGTSKNVYVFVIPVSSELDLKKAAKAAGEKSVEMVKVSEINALTGYIRGGCSPVGMKKRYPTFINESAKAKNTVYVSAGKIGSQVELEPLALAEICGAQFSELVKDK
ncbi:MAG: Cys-tRNA(Pro) deacylase [Clostridia bacterium]|nr:Cys-tRNA(Pro) deacylase [Clostridiales bacterium]MDO4354503.1 Cys-tRNA(Pro) deacylase [Clostridia bacterium]MDY2909904.1 Cys-tRNA(Pro) deacylase [Oscillospiraceae bacterium]